jgi:hypothetical protein
VEYVQDMYDSSENWKFTKDFILKSENQRDQDIIVGGRIIQKLMFQS